MSDDGEIIKTLAEENERLRKQLEAVRREVLSIQILIAPVRQEPEEAPNDAGCLEALQNAQVFIANCLSTGDLLNAVRDELALWEEYAEDLEDSHTSMRRLHALLGTTGKKEKPAEPKPDADGLLEELVKTGNVQDCLQALSRLDLVEEALDALIESIELNYSGEDELDGFVDADLIHADLVRIRTLIGDRPDTEVQTSPSEAPCDECDPSFGCFTDPSECSKRAPQTAGQS